MQPKQIQTLMQYFDIAEGFESLVEILNGVDNGEKSKTSYRIVVMGMLSGVEIPY